MSTIRAGGDLRSYILVTAAYWADTLTDGAIRMLVLFYFYQLGYSPFEVASLFLFYEVFGIATNLVGGWIAARLGLKATLFSGLSIQILALAMLGLAPESWLVVPYVMVSQALSGIAKDLTKMSSKSAVKLVVPEGSESTLFKWVAVLTGSKNALKGVGFFLGGLLLTVAGFQTAMLLLLAMVGAVLITTALMMHGGLGRTDATAKFRHMFSNNRSINVLAAARVFLFASRDVWFVVGLPVYLRTVLNWSFWQVGAFLAIWVIGYGIVQASAPTLMRRRARETGARPDGRSATWLAFLLAAFPAVIAVALTANLDPTTVLVAGLIAFGIVFALNSAVHSYLVLSYAEDDKVAMNVGFYYMANAGGRLMGTVLSGALYQWQGLTACLWASVILVLAAGFLSLLLPRSTSNGAWGKSRRQKPQHRIENRLTGEHHGAAIRSHATSPEATQNPTTPPPCQATEQSHLYRAAARSPAVPQSATATTGFSRIQPDKIWLHQPYSAFPCGPRSSSPPCSTPEQPGLLAGLFLLWDGFAEPFPALRIKPRLPFDTGPEPPVHD